MTDNFEDVIIELSRTGTHGNNPYHNFDHCLNVYRTCENIYRAEIEDEMPTYLTWAALFHDYNHSGGTTDDWANIEVAKEGVTDHVLSYISSGYNQGSLSPNDLIIHGYHLRRIHELIECTVFHKGMFPVNPVTFEEKAIRDADLSSIFLPTEEAVKSLRGLYQEMLVQLPTLTIEDFCKRNTDFLTKATWHTDYCQHLADTELADRLIAVHQHLLNGVN